MKIMKSGGSLLRAVGIGATVLGTVSLLNYRCNKIKDTPEYLRAEAKELSAKGEWSAAVAKKYRAECIEKADTSDIHRFALEFDNIFRKAEKDYDFEKIKYKMQEKKDYIKDGGILAVDDNIAIALENADVSLQNAAGTVVNGAIDVVKHMNENPGTAAATTVAGATAFLLGAYARRKYDEVAEEAKQEQVNTEAV